VVREIASGGCTRFKEHRAAKWNAREYGFTPVAYPVQSSSSSIVASSSSRRHFAPRRRRAEERAEGIFVHSSEPLLEWDA